MLLRAILCGSVWNGFLLGKARRWALVILGVYFSQPPSCTLGSCPNLLNLCPLIVASGTDLGYGMVGCLVLVVLVKMTPELPLLGI